MTGLYYRSTGDVIAQIRQKREIEDTKLAKQAGIRVSKLRDIESGVPPTKQQLSKLSDTLDSSPEALQMVAGEFPEELHNQIVENPDQALGALKNAFDVNVESANGAEQDSDVVSPVFSTDLGELYNRDCRDVLQRLEPASFDMIFADPPFNLGKNYGENFDDDLTEVEYLHWCTEWIDQAIELLAPGGAFFIYNLPKWNSHLSHYLSKQLNFRHWITIDIKFGLPIPNRLYPSHYSLLYFVKGEGPETFHPDRLPIDTCPHCGGEQNDYGGYKSKMNSKGVSLTDVWDDIPPVRHSKHLNRDANQLSVKLLHRLIGMATDEGDKVLDPFGGAGTTYATAEIMNRRWVGTELHDCSPITERFDDLDSDRKQIHNLEQHQNVLFTEQALKLRSEYKSEFGFNFDDYDLSDSPTSNVSIQQSFNDIK